MLLVPLLAEETVNVVVSASAEKATQRPSANAGIWRNIGFRKRLQNSVLSFMDCPLMYIRDRPGTSRYEPTQFPPPIQYEPDGWIAKALCTLRRNFGANAGPAKAWTRTAALGCSTPVDANVAVRPKPAFD